MRPVRRRILPIGGLSALVIGLVGMAAAPDSAGNWFGYRHGSMMGFWDGRGHEMMGGWDGRGHDEPAPPRIAGARQISAQAGEFVFDPSRIEIRAGRPVNIRLSNRGALFHDFTIEDLDFHLSAAPGEHTTGGLEPAEKGSYRFVCTVPGHAEVGMVGTLVVR